MVYQNNFLSVGEPRWSTFEKYNFPGQEISTGNRNLGQNPSILSNFWAYRSNMSVDIGPNCLGGQYKVYKRDLWPKLTAEKYPYFFDIVEISGIYRPLKFLHFQLNVVVRNNSVLLQKIIAFKNIFIFYSKIKIIFSIRKNIPEFMVPFSCAPKAHKICGYWGLEEISEALPFYLRNSLFRVSRIQRKAIRM